MMMILTVLLKSMVTLARNSFCPSNSPLSLTNIEDEAAALDKSNIIQGGRRTRGKRIDYSQFGPDKDEDEM